MSDTEQLTPTPKKTNPMVPVIAIAGAVVAAVVLAVFVVVPLFSEDDAGPVELELSTTTADDETAFADETARSVGTDEALDPTEVTAAGLPLVTYEVFLDQNPFTPVRPDSPPTPTESDGDGATPIGDDDSSSGTGSEVTPRPGPTSGALTLLEFISMDDGSNMVRIRVNDIDYVVGTGSSFADGYRIDAINDPCIDLTTPVESTSVCLASTPGGVSGCAQAGTVVCDGRTITLLDVVTTGSAPVIVVQVDTTVYEVTQDESFAGQFRVLSTAPPCVTFGYGDITFTLCEGDSVMK